MEIAEFLKFFVLNYSDVVDGCRESTKQELPTATVDRFPIKRSDAESTKARGKWLLRMCLICISWWLHLDDPKNSLQSTAIENHIQSKSDQ